MKTAKLIQTETYEKNINNGSINPCARCGKEVKNEKYTIHLIEGNNTMLSVKDEINYISDSADMGFFPIGSECAKHISKEFLHN